MSLPILRALNAAAKNHRWKITVVRDKRDAELEQAFVTMTRGSRERILATVVFDHLHHDRPTGELVSALDEHGALAGRRALIERIAQEQCLFCPGGNR